VKPKLIAVVGPTSSGKSALGVFLAQKLNGEVISTDSRQVYKGLNIGTGKVTKKEMAGVPHHLLDVVSPTRQFSVDDFVKHAEKVISGLIYQATPKIPIVVGGTGLYIDALLGRISYPNVPPDKKLRERLERLSTKKLFAQLKKLDPRRARTVEPHNKRRLIRAIEIARTIGHSPVHRATLCKYDALWLGLNPPPKRSQKNIHIRLFARIRAGMIAEARRLHARGLPYKRMEELGLEYRYLARLLQNKITNKEFLEQLEREINRYAKRQVRWFKSNKDIHWIKTHKGKGSMEALCLAKEFLSR